MDEKQEVSETPEAEVDRLTDDPSVIQAISFLERTVDEKIGLASDGRP